MTVLQLLRRQFEFDHWANNELVAMLRQNSAAPEKARGLVAHILAAEWVWYGRLKNEPQRFAVWPDFSVDECERFAKEIHGLWALYLDHDLAEAGLEVSIHYSNSKGEKHSSTIAEVLQHVIIHGAYHRGQIALLMRTNGFTPAYTDFIHPTRCHLI